MTDIVFLTQPETAKLLRLSERTLERMRVEGSGPRFCKFGRRVVYPRAGTLEWAEARSRSSTSDEGASQ